MPLMLVSPAFAPGGAIPPEYTCDGADISPPLSWSGVPGGTRSLVLVIEDPDAPGGVFRHWAVFDIPPTLPGLAAGYGERRPAAGLHEARNDFAKTAYDGPCPPEGGGTHHYHFLLFAISRPTLDLRAPTTALDVRNAALPYAIARGDLVGTYRR